MTWSKGGGILSEIETIRIGRTKDAVEFMNDWYLLTLGALALMSAQRFLYKTAAEKKCDTAATTFAFFATVAVASTLLFLAEGAKLQRPAYLVAVAFVNAASFTAATVAHMESLKHVPAAEAYSLIRLNVILVVLFSVFYFGDRLSALQISGIILALAVIKILTGGGFGIGGYKGSGNARQGFALVSISLLAGAVASISSKFAALNVDKFAFISLTYIFSALFSFFLKGRIFKGKAAGKKKESLRLGIAMGVLNIGGYFSFLKALETGPLSVVAMIAGMHFVVAIALSALIYGEKPNARQTTGVALTVVSILLMRS